MGTPTAWMRTTHVLELHPTRVVAADQFGAAYIADMEAIHDKDEKLFAHKAMDGSTSFKTFARQTDLIVKRHIGELHGLDPK